MIIIFNYKIWMRLKDPHFLRHYERAELVVFHIYHTKLLENKDLKKIKHNTKLTSFFS